MRASAFALAATSASWTLAGRREDSATGRLHPSPGAPRLSMGVVDLGGAMLVRPYTIADREACLRIFDSNVPRFFRAGERAEYEGFLERRPGPFFVVEDEAGAVVASGGIAPGRAEPEIAVLCWGMVRS